MHELCFHKIGPDKSDQAIGLELKNACKCISLFQIKSQQNLAKNILIRLKSWLTN